MDYFYYNWSVARSQFDAEMLYVMHRYFDFVVIIIVIYAWILALSNAQ
jgi:hypothetical protein